MGLQQVLAAELKKGQAENASLKVFTFVCPHLLIHLAIILVYRTVQDCVRGQIACFLLAGEG